jgi:hypothetical protein
MWSCSENIMDPGGLSHWKGKEGESANERAEVLKKG